MNKNDCHLLDKEVLCVVNFGLQKLWLNILNRCFTTYYLTILGFLW